VNVIDPNMTSKSCFSSCWGGGGLDGAAEMFANRVKKRSMDASHAICETGESRGRKRPISDDRPSLPPLCGDSYRGRSRVGITF